MYFTSLHTKDDAYLRLKYVAMTSINHKYYEFCTQMRSFSLFWGCLVVLLLFCEPIIYSENKMLPVLKTVVFFPAVYGAKYCGAQNITNMMLQYVCRHTFRVWWQKSVGKIIALSSGCRLLSTCLKQTLIRLAICRNMRNLR